MTAMGKWPSLDNGGGAEGADLRHERQDTGAVAGGAFADVVVPLVPPFLDANYTVVAGVQENVVAGTNGALVRKVVAKAADSVTVRVSTVTALGAGDATIHVVAVHD